MDARDRIGASGSYSKWVRLSCHIVRIWSMERMQITNPTTDGYASESPETRYLSSWYIGTSRVYIFQANKKEAAPKESSEENRERRGAKGKANPRLGRRMLSTTRRWDGQQQVDERSESGIWGTKECGFMNVRVQESENGERA